MKKGYIFALAWFCLFLASCGMHQNKTTCNYEALDNSTMEKYFAESKKEYAVSNAIKNRSVKITNQKIALSDMVLRLEEYYYDKVTGAVAYKVLIEGLDGKGISNKQYKELQRTKEDGELYLFNERGGKTMNNLLQKENQKLVWYSSFLLNGVSSNDNVKKYKEKARLETVSCYYNGDKVGEYQLPEYCCEEKILSFDVANNVRILDAKISEEGIAIVWDIREILEKYHQMLKELPDGEDPECHGYRIYSSLVLNKKDGGKIDLLDCCNNSEVIEEQKLGSFNAVFTHAIQLENIKDLEIDGKRYAIKIQ